jgi:hypothetical protein
MPSTGLLNPEELGDLALQLELDGIVVEKREPRGRVW